MEEILFKAAAKLPEPGRGYPEVEAWVKMQKIERCPNRKRNIVILTAVLCLLVTACAYSSTKYGLWGGYHSYSFSDARKAGETFNFGIPEALNGSPFQNYSTAYGAPEGYTHLQALLMPTYKLYTVHYAIEKEEIKEDGSSFGWQEKSISISFGTTEKEQWKYHFSVAEDGSKNYHGVNPGSNGIVEYNDYTLHLYSIGDCHGVMWEDRARNMILNMTCYDLASQEEAVEIAKELIDLNRR